MTNHSKMACAYAYGLVQSDRRNMECMAEVTTDCNSQSLQHFLSNVDWKYEDAFSAVSKEVDGHLGGYDDSALLIDETCSAKKGTKSVGVQRQWLGRYGKVDNGQVLVCAGLSRGDKIGLIDTRLFLGEKWTDDRQRSLDAGVPEDRIAHQTKQALALEMVKQSRANGVRFSWVGADGLYGNDPSFLRELDAIDETFMIDCHNDQRIWLEDPKPYLPKRTGSRGRMPSRLASDIASTTVREWARAQPANAWKRKSIRKSYKGVLHAEFLSQRVYLWNKEEETAQYWWLIVRRECGKKNEIKYSLSNAAPDAPLQQLVRMQAQRFWIERGFEDAKSQAGFDHYQVRGWRGLHHHLAMVFLVLLFMLEFRLSLRTKLAKISCADIIKMLRVQLPRRLADSEAMARHIEEKNMQIISIFNRLNKS